MNREQRRAMQKQPMYQAMVTERDERGVERDVAVGPRSNTTGIAERLCERINRAVVAGKEKRWANARVVTVN